MAEILTEQLDAINRKQGQGQAKSDLDTAQVLPKGVVLDKDGKPCRTCTSLSSWRALTRMKTAPTSSSKSSDTTDTAEKKPLSTLLPSPENTSLLDMPNDCPPDVEVLGRSTWTLLHSMAGAYPTKASPTQQNDMHSFLSLFSKLYPCWVCADDFRAWMNEPSGKNKPQLKGRAEFGNWMCNAHNEVNRKLGKKEFDCSKWEERWRTGWKDGRCD
ncbi:hypothetical protein FQN57_004468 [Myotisia sp. PD_48]|nr:hypothetical protein FQN57_004468 [Myotisia sp. PD_48]